MSAFLCFDNYKARAMKRTGIIFTVFREGRVSCDLPSLGK
ncbi:hypothetical protein DB29_02211 [Shouchella clausii]|nr:hypothetical protein DB29_02211 [Shouchella clausii]